MRPVRHSSPPAGVEAGTVDRFQGREAPVVLACDPALLTLSCRAPDQMRLANVIARFVELATRAMATGVGSGV